MQPFPFGSVNRAIALKTGEGPLADALRDLARAAQAVPPPPPASDVKLANTMWIAGNGNDGTAEPNSLSKPYLTLTAAVAAAVGAGFTDVTFYVQPGIYFETVTIPAALTHAAVVGSSPSNTLLDGLIYQPNGGAALLQLSLENIQINGIGFDGSNAALGASARCVNTQINNGAGFNAMLGLTLVDFEVTRGGLNITNSQDVIGERVRALGAVISWRRDQALAGLVRTRYLFNALVIDEDLLLGGELQAAFTATEVGGQITTDFRTFHNVTYDEAVDVDFSGRAGSLTTITFAVHQVGQTTFNRMGFNGTFFGDDLITQATAGVDPNGTSTVVTGQVSFAGSHTLDNFTPVLVDARGSGLTNGQINGGDGIGPVDREMLLTRPLGRAAPGTSVIADLSPPFPSNDYGVFANVIDDGTPGFHPGLFYPTVKAVDTCTVMLDPAATPTPAGVVVSVLIVRNAYF